MTLLGVGPGWLNVVGLSLDLAGAVVLASGLFVTKRAALNLGLGRWASESPDENLKLPQVRDRLRQSRNAWAGVVLLVVGFLMQIVAGWPGTA